MKANTKAYLQYPKEMHYFSLIEREKLIVHSLQLNYDSSDLNEYLITDDYQYDSFSILQVMERFRMKFESFIKQDLGVEYKQSPIIKFDKLIDADINVRLRPMGDGNNHTAWRSIQRLKLQSEIYDTLYHLFSELTFRQDICVGCAFSGYGKEMHAVLHFKYAVIHRSKIVFYKEILVPNPIRGNDRNKENTDAQLVFKEDMDKVLFYFLEKDLKRIFN